MLTAFLNAGIPLSCFRLLLKKSGLQLTDRSHMANLIPYVLENEKTRLKLELGMRDISIIFDGTTRLGEVLVVAIRYLDDEWNIQ